MSHVNINDSGAPRSTPPNIATGGSGGSGLGPSSPVAANNSGGGGGGSIIPAPISRCLNHPIVRRFLIVEWVVTITFALIAWLIGHLSAPHCREFSWNDASISFPFDHHEEFPNWSLLFIAGTPALVYILFGRYLHNYSWEEVNMWCLIQGQSVAIMLVMVDPAKLYAGRLRPDFLDRLKMSGYGPSSFSDPFDYCSVEDPKRLIRQGRLSFPSGHSSLSFAAMVPLTMFLIISLRVFQNATLLRFFGAITPMILAFVVAISRTRDHRHHFSDILGGAVIGFVAALLSIALRLQFVSSPVPASGGAVISSRLAWRRSVATAGVTFLDKQAEYATEQVSLTQTPRYATSSYTAHTNNTHTTSNGSPPPPGSAQKGSPIQSDQQSMASFGSLA